MKHVIRITHVPTKTVWKSVPVDNGPFIQKSLMENNDRWLSFMIPVRTDLDGVSGRIAPTYIGQTILNECTIEFIEVDK